VRRSARHSLSVDHAVLGRAPARPGSGPSCDRRYYEAKGIHGASVEAELLEHANEEQAHADRVAKRITELGGSPNLQPRTVRADTLEEMIKDDLVAERIAIATYSEIVRWLGNDDPTTRRMMEELLAKEEEHADDLVELLSRVAR
jgi:bacterioferritin